MRTRPKPTSPSSSKILLAGKLKNTTLPHAYGRADKVEKIILYLDGVDKVLVESAIKKLDPKMALGGVGNHNGRAIAAICLEWLEGRGK